MHIYTLVFLVAPVYFGISQTYLGEISAFNRGGPLFTAFVFVYLYGFAIHNFPYSQTKALQWMGGLLGYLLFLFLTTTGINSIKENLDIYGLTVLIAMLGNTAWKLYNNSFRNQKPDKKYRYQNLFFIFLCIAFIGTSLKETIRYFFYTRDGLNLFLSILSFGIGVAGTFLLHFRSLQKIRSVMHWYTKDAKETQAVGKQLSENLIVGDIVLLYGDLGTGKTTLTQGIAAELGVEKNVTSPTFGLMNVYKIINHKSNLRPELRSREIINLVHVDTYRLKDEKELVAIGVEEYLGAPDTVCIIEWPEKVERLLAGKKVKKIYLKHQGEEKRKITFEN